MSKYIVKPVVCDYGIFIVDDEGNEELVEVCNSQANANTICEIFNADLMKDGQYTIWKDDKIADLEAKLAEKESEIKVGEFWHSAYQGKQLDYDKVYAELRQSYDENEKLKQQLAEKEKEIDRLKLLINSFDKLKQYDKDADLILLNPKTCYTDGHELIIKTSSQDKIEFAIDILKQIRNEIPLLAGVAQGKNFLVNYNQFKYHIDQRIKQLKESELTLLEEEDN